MYGTEKKMIAFIFVVFYFNAVQTVERISFINSSVKRKNFSSIFTFIYLQRSVDLCRLDILLDRLVSPLYVLYIQLLQMSYFSWR